MSLNNFLCKHFEKDSKGNVTIGNIFGKVFISFPILCSIPITMFRGTHIDSKNTYLFSCMNLTDIVLLYLNTLFYIIIILFGIEMMFKFLNYISNISVAQCPKNK